MSNAEVVPTPGAQTRTSRKLPKRAVPAKTLDSTGYARAFNHLCHLVPLTRAGKAKAVIDDLVITAFVLDETVPLSTPKQIAEALYLWFELRLAESDVKESVERHLSARRLSYDQNVKTLHLALAPRAEAQQRIDQSRQLEDQVRSDWSATLLAAGVDQELIAPLWDCLRCYMAKAFMRHGALAVELLNPTVPTADRDVINLGKYLDEAIQETSTWADSARVRLHVSSFFSDVTPSRARYLAQLLDCTFTFFALTVNDATTTYMKGSLAPLQLFLDTNFIFGLFDMHENPMAGVSKELIAFIKDGGFPFTLYYHERTLREIQHSVTAASSRLLGRLWSPSLSRAAVQAEVVSGIELAYHKLNAEAPLDAKVFLSKWEHIDQLLADMGVKIYRPPADEGYTVERKGELIAEYQHYVEKLRPQRPRVYEVADHDITVWLTVQNKRKKGRSALDAGALFLSNDVLFSRFDWSVLRNRDEVGTVVLPAQLLQVLRPFGKSNEDYDRRFGEAFAVPELRSAHNDYGDTVTQVLSFLRTYKDVPQETAVRILASDMLMHQLRGAEDGSLEFKELIDSAVMTANQVLVEEAEALRSQVDRERQEKDEKLADYQAQLGSVAQEADDRVEKARIEERAKAAANVAAVEADRTQEITTLGDALSRTQDEVQALKDESATKDAARASRRRRWRLGLAAILFTLGSVALFVVPNATGWHWLLGNSHLVGIYMCVLLIWGSACWTLARPKAYKTAIVVVGLGALLVLTGFI